MLGGADRIRMGTTDRIADAIVSGVLPDSRCLPEVLEPPPRIALLTPYNGGNLGDAVIQDALIANLRLRLSGAQFSGISLNCDNFVERHGVGAFALCATNRPFYGMSQGSVTAPTGLGYDLTTGPSCKGHDGSWVRRALKKLPGVWKLLRRVRAWLSGARSEVRHWLDGYRFLRTQDLLIVSGGGQLDEEWGGAWGHPFALFKWAVLARIARIPYVIVSVGAQRATSAACRLFLSAALRMARYRSYRDNNSRKIAAGMLRCATADPIVPDLAFSMPTSELPRPAGMRSMAQDRPVVAISPIAYAKAQSWPHQHRAIYERYVHQMRRVISELLERRYNLVIVCSSIGDDDGVIPELLEGLQDESKKKFFGQISIPRITTWKDFAASLMDVNFLIASRLHSTILGFLTHTPVVAISFDPKVDWVMEDLGQTDYLLQIRTFTAEDVIEVLERIQLRRHLVVEQIASYQHRISSICKRQYDALSNLAIASCQNR